MGDDREQTVEQNITVNAAMAVLVAEILRVERGHETRDVSEAMVLIFEAGKRLGAALAN